jgi:hypothetical protein
MAIHILSTRYARFENGEYVEYPAGIEVDLSPEEVEIFCPGVATMTTSTLTPEIDPSAETDSGSRTIFRTTLAQPKKKSKLESDSTSRSGEVSDATGSVYCEGDPEKIK